MLAIRKALAEHGDASRAEGMRAYMKSSMPYRGVTLPAQRQLYRPLFEQFQLASFEDWYDTIVALWDGAEYREERYAALALIGDRRYAAFRTLEALPLFERLILDGAWWDLVDDLATHEVGDLLRHYPSEMRSKVLDWSRGSDPWLRRTSIICQVGFKAATNEALLFECIQPSLRERGFFLRKAIGWALREYGKIAPGRVARYVADHADVLSPLSRREALKYVAR